MQALPSPYTRDLVLIGGGHTHALVLRAWAMKPLPGARVTLINPEPTAAYSGMLPGYVAGHYSRDALDIDLVRLAQFAGVRLILGSASGIDRVNKRIAIEGQPDVSYDILSIDIGITSDMKTLDGFSLYAVPAKPLGPFAAKWKAYVESARAGDVVVLGGGVAGAELAMAMSHRLHTLSRRAQVTILERDRAFSTLGPRAAAQLRCALSRNGVKLLEQAQAVRISAGGVLLASGETLAADFVVGAAGAAPHPWLARSGLTNAAGFVPVDDRLRSGDKAIFAVGDCAEMIESPRPKAGVYAVRQAPVLLHNLRAALAETGGLKPYRPQKNYLKLISLGAKSAQAERFGQSFAGPALWRLKDRIDRKFMARFHKLPERPVPVLPWPRAAGALDAQASELPCGGCGAKIGPKALTIGLNAALPGDDAARIGGDGAQQVISTDHLRAFLHDPVAMTRIAAIHALGDMWAMGATPQAAVANIILPRQSDRLAARQLREVMETARATFDAAGATLAGGHSTLGSEMTIGFTVTGVCEVRPIGLGGAQPGDQLVLTKPIGTGVVMAAHMRYRALGKEVESALTHMKRDQTAAARHLGHAHAMTDVTGFGLAGHLANICAASATGARLKVDAVPLLPGALRLSEEGIRSTLYPQNRAAFEAPETPRANLMFDPQTSGGLLAAIAAPVGATVDALNMAGFEAAVIGEVTDRVGQIEFV